MEVQDLAGANEKIRRVCSPDLRARLCLWKPRECFGATAPRGPRAVARPRRGHSRDRKKGGRAEVERGRARGEARRRRRGRVPAPAGPSWPRGPLRALRPGAGLGRAADSDARARFRASFGWDRSHLEKNRLALGWPAHMRTTIAKGWGRLKYCSGAKVAGRCGASVPQACPLREAGARMPDCRPFPPRPEESPPVH